MSSLRAAVIGIAAFCVASVAYEAFVSPAARPAPLVAAKSAASTAPPAAAAGWGLAAAGLAVGAHAGLAVAFRARAARQAETKPAEKSKYVETVADERLFEQVYLQYTSEYLKGPLYWHPDKLQGWLPDYPGTPMIKEGKYTSHVIGNLKAFSSNELAFLSMLFFGVGLYGNLQFNFYDPQWAKVDAGGFFNVSYIVESFLLPISFFMHIACYIQRQNGKHEAKAQQKAQQHGSFSARQSTERAKMQSLYATRGARRAEAQTASSHQQERRRSETELKVRQKSQKLESMQSERQQLWQLRKEAQSEARKILRSAKGEVERQAMSSRFSLQWLERQMARLEQPEALANSSVASGPLSPQSSRASLAGEASLL
eukprot:s3588_g3.t1